MVSRAGKRRERRRGRGRERRKRQDHDIILATDVIDKSVAVRRTALGSNGDSIMTAMLTSSGDIVDYRETACLGTIRPGRAACYA